MARSFALSLSVMIALGSTPAFAQQALGACEAMAEPTKSLMSKMTEITLEPGKKLSVTDMPLAPAQVAEYFKKVAEQQKKDWPNLCRYRADNEAIVKAGVRPRVIFLGDSITENWKPADPAFFGSTTLDRGVGGQTTPQILLRMYADVIRLRPQVVHILAGTNDVSSNTGPATDEMIVDNLTAMIKLAKVNGIRVVLAAITPTNGFVLRPDGFNPAPRIAGLNVKLRRLAAMERVTFVDYDPVLAGSAGGLKPEFSNDKLHPNRAGYAVMKPLVVRAIAQALR